jgi:predicted ATP-dependent endonuclease of OLD family
VVLATHAPEILAEADRGSVVLIDRTKTTSRRVTDETILADLNAVLGSGFNLRLAKALRSRVALFVEGQDMRIIRNLAKTVGANLVADEVGLSVTPMGGASRLSLAASFGWLNSTLLDSAVDVMAIIDRDYMDDTAVGELMSEFDSGQTTVHVWARKELESYLLHPAAIARISRLSLEQIEGLLDVVVEELKEKVFGQTLALRILRDRKVGIHESTTYEKHREEFDKNWGNRTSRLSIVPAKDALTRLNKSIQSVGGKAVSARALSYRLLAHEIPEEMRDVLLDVNSRLA